METTTLTEQAGLEASPRSVPSTRRFPVSAHARHACAAAAAMAALGGSWLLSKSAGAPPESAPRLEAPTPRIVSVSPSPDPLVSFSPNERPTYAGEEGLVSYLLQHGASPLAAILTPSLDTLESRFEDKRSPEHIARAMLAVMESRAGLAKAEGTEGFITVGLGNERSLKSRSNAGFRLGAIYGDVQKALIDGLGTKEALGEKMERNTLAMTLRGGKVARKSLNDVWADNEEALFTEEILAQNPDKPICRMGGAICRTPDGEFFALESLDQYDELAKDGLVVFPSPLVFDLDGDGVRTSDRKVRFDINGDGVVDNFNDISSKDGLLVFDAEGDGLSGEHARELFGTETDLDRNGLSDGFENGFEAFAGFVAKARKDGTLGPAASEWLEASDVAALEKRYGLRMRVGGLRAKAVSLAEAGVSRIRLSAAEPRRIRNFDGQKNDLMRQAGARFARADGSEGVYEDVWFRAKTSRASRALAKKAKAKAKLVRVTG